MREPTPRAIPAQITVVSVTIPAGEALSDAADLTRGVLVYISVDAWGVAPMSFQVSANDVEYYDLFDDQGREVMLDISPHTANVASVRWRDIVRYIKVRAGVRNDTTPPVRDRII